MLKLAAPEKLERLFKDYNLGQRAAARACAVSPATINRLVRQGHMVSTGWDRLHEALTDWMAGHGVKREDIARALTTVEITATPLQKGGEPMIIRKQRLSSATRQHFKLVRDPFADPQQPADIFLSPETRYVREAMYDAASNGNFLAVVGDSGSGKSTLREELVERLRVSGEPVIIIEPYTLSMAETDRVGKPLRATHIAEAVISTVAPGQTVPASPEMRARKLHKTLVESCRSGFRHCLIIEEAHDLHMHTLKSLKRFWELKDGMRRLLSIILIGQTELRDKLGNTQSSVREVVQRCDIVDLSPIKDPGAFLAHRFQRAGVDNYQAQSSANWGRNTITVRDVARGDTVTCSYVAFAKAPDKVFAQEGGTLQWTFHAGKIEGQIGSGTPELE